MSITNYTQLKSTIAEFLDRDDLTSIIPTFISLAEAQMSREIRHYRMVQRSRAQIDSRYTAIPADWVETIRFNLTEGNTYRINLTSIADMLQLREERGNEAGTPTHYAHIGASIEVFPNPDAVYEAELMYYEKIPALSDSNASNWLLGIAPDAYLYGALVQSSPYLKDDARMQVFGSLYAGAVRAVNEDNEKARFGGSGLRLRINSY